MSFGYGIPWEKNYYGLESSFSISDWLVWRFGVTATNYIDSANEYQESGVGFEFSGLSLALIFVGGHCGYTAFTAVTQMVGNLAF